MPNRQLELQALLHAIMELDGQRMRCSQYLALSGQGAFVEGTCFVVVPLHSKEESELVQGFSKGEMGGHKRLLTDRERTMKQWPGLSILPLVSIEHGQGMQVISGRGMDMKGIKSILALLRKPATRK